MKFLNIKYQAKDTATIDIWLEKGNEYNMLHFNDTGKGIAAEILPMIFDRFFSRRYHGTGLGLAFCKTVMKALHGDIECYSIEGEYTEFVLTFPKID